MRIEPYTLFESAIVTIPLHIRTRLWSDHDATMMHNRFATFLENSQDPTYDAARPGWDKSVSSAPVAVIGPSHEMKNRREFLQNCSSLALAAALSPEVLLAETAAPWAVESEPFSWASFRRCLGSTFRVGEGDASGAELTLAGVDALSRGSSGRAGHSECRGECFSLMFRGAADPALLQGTYEFDHLVLGRFAMLIVPMLSLDRHRACYQAVFNHAVPGFVEAPPNPPRSVHLQTRPVRQA